MRARFWVGGRQVGEILEPLGLTETGGGGSQRLRIEGLGLPFKGPHHSDEPTADLQVHPTGNRTMSEGI